MGLGYAIEEHVRFPLAGRVIGEKVSVLKVEDSVGLDVMAVCERDGRRYRVRLQDVELIERPPRIEWIDAYRQFHGRDGSSHAGRVR